MSLNDIKQADPKNSPEQEKYIFKIGLADVLRATMFGTIIAVTTDILRLPLHMPGHSSLYWMGILLIGKGLIKKFGSGITMGIVSGILAVIFGMGKEGVFVFFTYFIPGLLIDFLVPFFRYKLESIGVAAVCGALASLSKLAVNIILGIILNVPMLFLTLGLGYAAAAHAFYGIIGGVLASVIIKRLKPRLSNWD